MIEILFISYGVGGSQALNPIYLALKEGYKVKNIALTDFAQNHLSESILIEESGIYDYISTKRPKLVINERSNGVEVQNRVTKYCKETGIKNIVVLDFYGGYSRRFTELPDYIITPGKSVTEEMINEGFDYKVLKSLGSPAYDRLQQYKYTRLPEEGILKAIFLSQPFKEYGESITQVDILEDYINEIEKEYSEYSIDIKLHPNEEIETWEKYQKSNSVRILKHKPEEDTIKLCLDYDLVIGYNSTVQLQTLLLRVPTIFYDSNIKTHIREFRCNRIINQDIPYSDFNMNSLGGCIKFIKELLE